MRDPNEFGAPWFMIIALGAFLLVMVFGLSNLSQQDLGNPQPSTLITHLHHLEIERPDKDLYGGLGR